MLAVTLLSLGLVLLPLSQPATASDCNGQWAAAGMCGLVDGSSLTISGTREQVIDRIAAYDGVADTIKLTPPTHGLSPTETRAAQKEVIALIADLCGAA